MAKLRPHDATDLAGRISSLWLGSEAGDPDHEGKLFHRVAALRLGSETLDKRWVGTLIRCTRHTSKIVWDRRNRSLETRGNEVSPL